MPPKSRKPSKSPAKSKSKSPGRPRKSMATTPKEAKTPKEPKTPKTPASKSRSRSRGRPPKSASAAATPASVKPTPRQRSVSGARKTPAASRGRSPGRAATESASVIRSSPYPVRGGSLKVREHAITSSPVRMTRSASAKNGSGFVSGLCGAGNAVCNTVCYPFRSLRTKYRRNAFSRKDVLCIILFLVIAFGLYYTWNYKNRVYRDAYSYAQGYLKAAQDYIARK